MIVRIVTVKVKPGRTDEFERLTVKNHEGSLQEPGVLRFDVLCDESTPGTYYLYEAYRDEAATRDHKKTEHYHAWKEAVGPLLDGDRSAVTCSVVAPTDTGRW